MAPLCRSTGQAAPTCPRAWLRPAPRTSNTLPAAPLRYICSTVKADHSLSDSGVVDVLQ